MCYSYCTHLTRIWDSTEIDTVKFKVSPSHKSKALPGPPIPSAPVVLEPGHVKGKGENKTSLSGDVGLQSARDSASADESAYVGKNLSTSHAKGGDGTDKEDLNRGDDEDELKAWTRREGAKVIASQAREDGFQLTTYECLAIIMNFSKAEDDALDDVQIDSLINVRSKLPAETWQALEGIALGVLDAENEAAGGQSSDAEETDGSEQDVPEVQGGSGYYSSYQPTPFQVEEKTPSSGLSSYPRFEQRPSSKAKAPRDIRILDGVAYETTSRTRGRRSSYHPLAKPWDPNPTLRSPKAQGAARSRTAAKKARERAQKALKLAEMQLHKTIESEKKQSPKSNIRTHKAAKKDASNAISTTLEYMKRRQALRTLEAQQEAHNSERAYLQHGLRRAQIALEEERKAHEEEVAKAKPLNQRDRIGLKKVQKVGAKLERMNNHAKVLRRQLSGLKSVGHHTHLLLLWSIRAHCPLLISSLSYSFPQYPAQSFLSSAEKLKQDLFALILIVADKDVEGAKAAVEEREAQTQADAEAKMDKQVGIYVRVDAREDSTTKAGEWARLLARNAEFDVASFDAAIFGKPIRSGDCAMQALSPIFCNAASGKQTWVVTIGRRKDRIVFDSAKQPGLMTLGVQRILTALTTAGREVDEVEFVVTSVELFDGRWRDLVSCSLDNCDRRMLSCWWRLIFLLPFS